MKIIHIIPCLACGGAENLMGNIAIEQINQGHDVKIIVLESFDVATSNYPLKNELVKLIDITHFDIDISFSFLKNQIVLSNNSFFEFIKEFKPDVIHSHLFKSEIISRNKIVKDVKYITHCHNNMTQFDIYEKKSFKRRLTDFLEYKWLRTKYKQCNNHFIVISNDTELFYKKHLPKQIRSNIFQLKNGINTSLYWSNVDKANSPIVQLISVGSLLKNKGHSFLIDVVNSLIQEGVDVQLNILGDGPEMGNLLNKIDELGLGNSIFLLGSVTNVNDYLSQAHIYIHAAFKEAFGLVLIEAMASELPVISTNGGGNKDLIIENYNGFLIENRNMAECSKKIKLLIDNPSLRLQMGKNAIDFSKSFDIKEYVVKLHEIYLK